MPIIKPCPPIDRQLLVEYRGADIPFNDLLGVFNKCEDNSSVDVSIQILPQKHWSFHKLIVTMASNGNNVRFSFLIFNFSSQKE